IPLVPGYIQPSFNLPAKASSVRILSSTMSMQGGNLYPATIVQGAVMTAYVNYGATMLLCAAGGGEFLTPVEKKFVIPVLQALTLELVQYMKGALNSNGPDNSKLAEVIETAAFWEAQALIVGKMLVNIGVQGTLRSLAEGIAADITIGVAEDCIPVVGQIGQALSI